MADLDRVYDDAGKYWNVDPDVLRAVHQVEDPQNDPKIRSRAGAIGHMQFMPDTARRLSIDPTDPVQSIYGAARLLDENLKHYGNLPDALRAYNGGTDRTKWGNPETMAYPGKVATNYQPAQKGEQTSGQDAFGATFAADLNDEPTPSAQKPSGDAFNAMFGHEDEERTGLPAEAKWHQGGVLGNLWQAFKDEESDADHEVERAGIYVASHIPGLRHALAGTGVDLDKARASINQDEHEQSGHWAAPYSQMVGHLAGDAVVGGGLMGGTRAAGMGLVSRLGPQAGRIAEAATNLLTGEKGNVLTRSLGGALQGAGTAELTDQNPLAGALLGGAGSPILHGATGTALKVADGGRNALQGARQSAKSSGNALMDSLAPREDTSAVGAADDPISEMAQHEEGAARDDALSAAQTKRDAVKLGIFASPKHAQDYANRIINNMRSGPIQVIDSAIPGVKLTAAQATGDPGLALTERVRRANNPGPFSEMDRVNAEARGKFITGVIGTPEQLDAAQAARDAAEGHYRPQVFADQKPVNIAPVVDHLKSLIEANKGRSTVQKPLQGVMRELAAVADDSGNALPEQLWNVRKYVGDIVSPAARGTENSGHAAAAQLMDLRPTLTNAIEEGASGFHGYLKQYEEMSRPIDAMRYLQSRNLTNANGEIQLGKLDGFIKSLEREQGKPGLRESDSVSPAQIERLKLLRDDMRLASRIDIGKARGSDTQANLVAQGRLAGMTQGLGANLASWAVGGAGGALLGGADGGVMGSLAAGAARRALENRLANTQAATYEALDNALLNPAKHLRKH
ncbi:lytic transglycosylase domain-containing protein [Gluconobacter cerinus]|uniref:lytic transglycosylase domain-containing protein n=1 Tax=Gluconobacter cerinus TaxID=38307 RepID=UPI001B8B0D3F|nr:lytic transglycosylase domain-containing protein [Gluconobacter cerinus]